MINLRTLWNRVFRRKKEISLNPSELPIVTSYRNIEQYDKEVIKVIGIYQQVDLRMKQENPVVLHKGHVAILLEDNYWAFLLPPEKKEAIRTKEEIEYYEGKIVEVVGRCQSNIPQRGNTMRAACFTEIHAINLQTRTRWTSIIEK